MNYKWRISEQTFTTADPFIKQSTAVMIHSKFTWVLIHQNCCLEFIPHPSQWGPRGVPLRRISLVYLGPLLKEAWICGNFGSVFRSWASHMMITDCLETIVANSDLIVASRCIENRTDLSWAGGSFQFLAFPSDKSLGIRVRFLKQRTAKYIQLSIPKCSSWRLCLRLNYLKTQWFVIFSHQDLTQWGSCGKTITHHQFPQRWGKNLRK